MTVSTGDQWKCSSRVEGGEPCALPFNHVGPHRSQADLVSAPPPTPHLQSVFVTERPQRVEQRYYYGVTADAAREAGRADSEAMARLGYRFLREDWHAPRRRSTRVFLYGAIGLLGGAGRLDVMYGFTGPGTPPPPPPSPTAPGLRLVHIAIGVAAALIVVIVVLGLVTGGP